MRVKRIYFVKLNRSSSKIEETRIVCQVRFADIQQEDGSVGRLVSQLKRCDDFQVVSYFHEFYMNDFPVMPVDRGR